jgi:hypothetical protein
MSCQVADPASAMWKKVEVSTLLTEHARLLRLHGPDSNPVYEFEMKHLENAEFLQRAVAEKRRLLQRQQERYVFFWFLLLVAALIAFQFSAIALLLCRHFP